MKAIIKKSFIERFDAVVAEAHKRNQHLVGVELNGDEATELYKYLDANLVFPGYRGCQRVSFPRFMDNLKTGQISLIGVKVYLEGHHNA